MIAAFGLAHEIEPGVVAINDRAIVAVHLTKLTHDGSARTDTEPNKIMIGRPRGSPMVLAPLNGLLGPARWEYRTRRIVICYEMMAEFSQLYRAYRTTDTFALDDMMLALSAAREEHPPEQWHAAAE